MTRIQEKAISHAKQELDSLKTNTNLSTSAGSYAATLTATSTGSISLLPYIALTPDATSRAILHAMNSAYPMCRYLVGLDARVLRKLHSYLPQIVLDTMLYLATSFESRSLKH